MVVVTLHNKAHFIKHCDLVQGTWLVENLTCTEASVRLKVFLSVLRANHSYFFFFETTCAPCDLIFFVKQGICCVDWFLFYFYSWPDLLTMPETSNFKRGKKSENLLVTCPLPLIVTTLCKKEIIELQTWRKLDLTNFFICLFSLFLSFSFFIKRSRVTS